MPERDIKGNLKGIKGESKIVFIPPLIFNYVYAGLKDNDFYTSQNDFIPAYDDSTTVYKHSTISQIGFTS